MSDQRRTWIRTFLVRSGRELLNGLAAMGTCWGGGSTIGASARFGAPWPPDDDAGVRDEARRGIAELETYLAAVDPVRRADERHRRRGDA